MRVRQLIICEGTWFDYCRELSTWFDAIVFADNSIYDFFSCHTKLFPLVTSPALAIITFLTVFDRKENLCVKEATKSTNFIYIDDKKSRKNRNELNLRCFSSSPTMWFHTFIPQTPNWISYMWISFWFAVLNENFIACLKFSNSYTSTCPPHHRRKTNRY